MGDVNERGLFEASDDLSLREVLNTVGKGMVDYQRIKLVQLGGPLGLYLRGHELDKKINEFSIEDEQVTILYLSETMCPVDMMRFAVRFTIREIRIDNDTTRELNDIMEHIANGRGKKRHLNIIKAIIEEELETQGEYLLQLALGRLMALFEDEILEHIYEKKCKNGICRGLILAQCINACPAEIYIPGYVELMKMGRHEEAYKLMRQNNPLSLICGRICSRPCEVRCRRGEIEKTVGVRALQRYASNVALLNKDFKEDQLESNHKCIAIVGAGPGGLSAAYYLARTGYEVTMYESKGVVGGMLAVGVPEYRLPYDDILAEIKTIENLGVKIELNMTVGKDISMEELKKKFDAVVLASGCHVANRIPGFEDEAVWTAIDFLRDVRVSGKNTIGKSVVVIGGGDVAMDAARTARRIGAESVRVMSLESYGEMPAGDEEKAQGQAEGIEFISSFASKQLTKNLVGKFILSLKKCLSVWDVNYNFSPVFDESVVKEIQCDTIILAVGQKPDMGYAGDGVVLNRGFAKVDKVTFETSLKGVYAIGDLVKPSVAIEAISSGRKVAASIDYDLGGTGLYVGGNIEVPSSVLNIRTWDDLLVEEKLTNEVDRVKNFDQVTIAYSEEEAMVEASRCMRCDRNSTRELLLTPRRMDK